MPVFMARLLKEASFKGRHTVLTRSLFKSSTKSSARPARGATPQKAGHGGLTRKLLFRLNPQRHHSPQKRDPGGQKKGPGKRTEGIGQIAPQPGTQGLTGPKKESHKT